MSARGALLGAALAVLAGLSAGCTGKGPDAQSCVLITLDTTRRDALGAFGGLPGVTPYLDAFAAECEAFDGARSVAPLTLPSHASMLTGLYPPRHTVRDNSLTPVPAAASTLAERARERGLKTGAVVAAAVLSKVYGLDQGFDSYDEPPRKGHTFAERTAEEVSERAVSWLGQRAPGERFFLWAHFFDAHRPYEPGERYLAQAGGDPYRGCVARMDAGVGALLDALRARTDWDDLLVIVVADHGEGLGEHGEQSHSAFVYDTTIRAPLLVRFPKSVGAAGGAARAGERSADPVSVADVFPTAVDLLGLGAPGDVDGLSLRDPPPPGRGVYFESCYGRIYHGWSTLAGWADAAGKYVHASAPELYDTAADPGEAHNLFGQRDAGPYVEALRKLALRPALAPSGEGVERSMLGAIEDLGYAGGGEAGALPDLLAVDPARPSPHARAAELAHIVQAWNLSSRGQLKEACAELELVVRSDPENHGAWSRLGRLRLEQGQIAEAAQAFERFAALGVPWAEDYLSLGFCYRRLERKEDAVTYLERGLALDPENERGLEELFGALQELGRGAEAAQVFARLEALRARS